MSNNFRPMSPHMEIYKFPLSGMLSGAHRITGVLVYLYIIIVSWLIIVSHYYSQLPKIIVLLATKNIGFFFMMLFVIGLFYHTFNGVRYLLWASGKCYETKSSNIIGVVGIFLTILTTAIFFKILR